MSSDDLYNFGPPPLTDEELMRLDDLFRYSKAETLRCVEVLSRPGATAAEKEAAIVELERIRGER